MNKREFIEQIVIKRMATQKLTTDYEIDEDIIKHSLQEYSKIYDILDNMFPIQGLGETNHD